MVMQTFGASLLVRLMRQERMAELDTSWLLHGPQAAPAEPEEVEPPFRWAAE